ncbi:MAG: 23S rRNA (guanosine(2251)-2'-O)-methyltransferase RlmB [Eggerthellaceae bacterium]|nr:23S rRNA (guanosine(2251)-2'-O)-methyltransferase RlmB [Eggerthellaceae bacterium]
MPDYIEGKRAVIEALKARTPLTAIYMADSITHDGLTEEICRLAKEDSVEIDTVPRRTLDDISERGAHQGIIAKAAPYSYVSVEEIIEAALEYADEHDGRALAVVLDHVTDAGNFGAIVRSAEAVGASGIVIANKRSASVNASTYKTSAGAIAHILAAQVPNISAAIDKFKDAGFWVAAASEYSSDVIWDADLKGKIVLVMGNEGEGVSRLVLEHCDFGVMLPELGTLASLNVAQAASVCMYEWLRQNLSEGE